MHNTELVLVPLSEEEKAQNFIDARSILRDLIASWSCKASDVATKKLITLTPEDVVIKVPCMRLELRCNNCGLTFESQDEAEESACVESPGEEDAETGVDAYFSVNIPKGEVVQMFGYRDDGELPKDPYLRHLSQDLSLQTYYVPPSGSKADRKSVV